MARNATRGCPASEGDMLTPLLGWSTTAETVGGQQMIKARFAMIRERASELGKRVGDTGFESLSLER